jgi:hypothetical protein
MRDFDGPRAMTDGRVSGEVYLVLTFAEVCWQGHVSRRGQSHDPPGN